MVSAQLVASQFYLMVQAMYNETYIITRLRNAANEEIERSQAALSKIRREYGKKSAKEKKDAEKLLDDLEESIASSQQMVITFDHTLQTAIAQTHGIISQMRKIGTVAGTAAAKLADKAADDL